MLYLSIFDARRGEGREREAGLGDWVGRGLNSVIYYYFDSVILVDCLTFVMCYLLLIYIHDKLAFPIGENEFDGGGGGFRKCSSLFSM